MKINGTNLLLISLVVATILSLMTGLFIGPIVIDTTEFPSWYFPLAVSLGYIAASFRFDETIGPNEIGVRLFFGQPTDTLQSGLPFAPLGFFTLARFSIEVIQREFPAEPEKIYRGELKERSDLPEGMKPPIRITFRNSVTEKQAVTLLGGEYSVVDEAGRSFTFNHNAPSDGLSKRITAEVVPVARFRIKDGIRFIRTIVSIDEAARQIEDEMVSVLSRLLTLMSVGQAKQNFNWINTILFAAVKRRTSTWGIELEPGGAFLKNIPLHHDLNSAIGDASEALFRAQQTVIDAGAERTKRIQEGEGAANAAANLAREVEKARGEGLKDAANVLGVNGEQVLAADVARKAAEGGNTIIVGTDGIGQLAGLAAAFTKKTPNP